jgi:IS5 family transposase
MASDDFFRARLDTMIDLKHSLAVLSTRQPWAAIEAVVAPKLGHPTLPAKRLRGEDLLGAYDVEFGGGVNPAGRPRLPIRLMTTLLYLKNSFNLSDEELVERCGARVCRRPAGGVAGGTGGRTCHHRAGFSVLAAVHVTAPRCSGLNFAGPTAYRIAFGPRAGQKVLTLQGAMPRERGFNQTLFADSNGFSLHAAVRWAADDR